jgi:hypothetical protein
MQFDEMKQGFIKKYEEISSKTVKTNILNRKLKKQFDEELSQEIESKNLFINQITELKQVLI